MQGVARLRRLSVLLCAVLACVALLACGLHQQSLPGRRPRQEDPLLRRSPSRRRRSTRRSPTRRPSTSSPATSTTRCSSTTTCERPYELIPGLAEAVPEPRDAADGQQRYRFRLRAGILFHDDPCFALSQAGPPDAARSTAADVAFELMRIADPAVNSPVGEHLRRRAGLRRLRQAPRRAAQGRSRVRGAAGARAVQGGGRHRGRASCRRRELELVLAGALPADPLLVRHAVHHADAVGGGRLLRRQGRAAPTSPTTGRHRAVPAGAYEKQHRIVLERNPNWYGRTPSRVARRPAPSSRPRATRRNRGQAASTRPTPAAAAVPRPHRVHAREGGHPALQQVPAGLLRRAASSRRASTRRRQTAICRRRWRRSACGSTRRSSRRCSTSASTWTTRSSARRPASGPQAAPGDEPRHRLEEYRGSS